jgi:Chemoreceptor zinc-binding domain
MAPPPQRKRQANSRHNGVHRSADEVHAMALASLHGEYATVTGSGKLEMQSPCTNPGKQVMNLTNAIRAHTDWKIKLRGAISERATLDAKIIEKDDCCELGQWLLGEARERFRAVPAHEECVLAHAKFHRCAADVAEVINAGDYDQAERMLDRGTPYALASRTIVLAIEELSRQMGENTRDTGA